MARTDGCPYVTDEVIGLSGYAGLTLGVGRFDLDLRSGSFPVKTLIRQPKLV